MEKEALPQPPMVPETLEGWALLHQIFRIRWSEWRARSDRDKLLESGVRILKELEKPANGSSAYFTVLGHKGDLMFLHFRRTVEELNEVELALAQCPLLDTWDQTTSYLSFVELGLYEMTVKIHEKLLGEGLERDSDAWKNRWKEEVSAQRDRMKDRLYPTVPTTRYVCFYPMDKKRGESVNWYTRPMVERQRMMRDHGFVGRKYAGQVTQIISGSTGVDDYEWGVDLFSEDALVFKRLIAEMRFDEASALYALFGKFYVGCRFEAEGLRSVLTGKLPPWKGKA